jgi:hypothetical protein
MLYMRELSASKWMLIEWDDSTLDNTNNRCNRGVIDLPQRYNTYKESR